MKVNFMAVLLAVTIIGIGSTAIIEEADAAKKGCTHVPNSVVCSKKTGVWASVSAKYRDRFQNYIDALEEEGASIYYMGGIRAGKCSIPANKHPCGMAMDICQDKRDGVQAARFCNLPPRSKMVELARKEGLFEGGAWCSADRGHVEVVTRRQGRACFDPFGRLMAKREAADTRIALAQLVGRGKVQIASVAKKQPVRVAAKKRARVHYAARHDVHRVQYAQLARSAFKDP